MKIGILSDTHIPRSAPRLPEKLCKALEGMDLILHAGDLAEPSVLEKLNKIAPTKAVYGNMDTPELQRSLPRKEIISAEGFKIGLIHGWGAPTGLIERVRKEFNGVDIIVFGHSHSALYKEIDGMLFLNPGSPTDKVFAQFNSYGILEIKDTIKGEIVKL